jgi:hypothetical protein
MSSSVCIQAQTKMKTKWMPYAGVSQVEPTRQVRLGIWNFPNLYYDQWSALPVEEFRTYEVESKDFPEPIRLNYLLEFGMYRWINQNGRLNLGLNLFNVYLKADDLGLLAFSDMIEASRGFVLASSLNTGSIETIFNNLAFESSYFIQQDFKKNNLAQRFGLGLNLNIVLRSQYHIYADVTTNHAPNPKYNYYYTNADLSIQDKAWSVFPTFYYEFRIIQVERGDLWLTASVSEGIALIPFAKRRKEERWNGNITRNNTTGSLNFGVKFDFNRD